MVDFNKLFENLPEPMLDRIDKAKPKAPFDQLLQAIPPDAQSLGPVKYILDLLRAKKDKLELEMILEKEKELNTPPQPYTKPKLTV